MTHADQFPDSEHEKEKQLEQATRHVAENMLHEVVPATRCVDGGYRKDQAGGEIAFPGADAGHAMVLMAQGLSPEQAFHLTATYRAQQLRADAIDPESIPDEVFFAHDDSHEGGCGCGHCKKGQEEAGRYGLADEAVDSLLALIASGESTGATVHNTILERDHTEQGILVLTDPSIDVLPWSEETGQYFIYAAARHEADLRALVEHVNSAIEQPISADAAWETAQAQTTQTLARLGTSAGAPMYTIGVNGENQPVVELSGFAPTLESLEA